MARVTRYGEQKLSVVLAIKDRLDRHSQKPTVRELADEFKVSAATMHSWLTKLNGEGMVEWTPGKHRSLRVTPAAIQLLSSSAVVSP